jgi:putative transcriptional regulator
VTKQYKSRAMASIHETAENLHAAGVMDKQTMRKFDEACLTPVRPLLPAEIKSLRQREGASQAVFARYLNVTPESSANGSGARSAPKAQR